MRLANTTSWSSTVTRLHSILHKNDDELLHSILHKNNVDELCTEYVMPEHILVHSDLQ